MITLKVEPRLAEIGGRLFVTWTGDVTEQHWMGLFPSGIKCSSHVHVM